MQVDFSNETKTNSLNCIFWDTVEIVAVRMYLKTSSKSYTLHAAILLPPPPILTPTCVIIPNNLYT